MKPLVLIVTLIAAVLLIPVAIRLGDILVLSFAGLIPFFLDLKSGDLD